jgi:serine/threonine protein kinase
VLTYHLATTLQVYKATLDEMERRNTPEYTVAAKTILDAKASPEATQNMLAEAGVMASVGAHPNLVSLIGVVTRGDPMVLIIQYCAQGEILGMLKKAAAEGTPILLVDKLRMAREIALGMEHLSKMHFIHRDLAARNVLHSEGLCKIADFGLSRGGGGGDGPDTGADDAAETHQDYYKSTAGVFPVRWTAPEAMQTLRFTQASDVWSFGIVVMELLNDGETPYHGMSNPDVMQMAMSGGQHAKPPRCSAELYMLYDIRFKGFAQHGVCSRGNAHRSRLVKLSVLVLVPPFTYVMASQHCRLTQCWDLDPIKRPTFTQLAAAIKVFYSAAFTGADANAERVEAAARDKTARGSAANVYASFVGEDNGISALRPTLRRPTEDLLVTDRRPSTTNSNGAGYFMASQTGEEGSTAPNHGYFMASVRKQRLSAASIGSVVEDSGADNGVGSGTNNTRLSTMSAASMFTSEEPAFEQKHSAAPTRKSSAV